MTLRTTITDKSSQVEELQCLLEIERDETKQLKVKIDEFKRIEELRISSSPYSEVIKYQRDAAAQFSYIIQERKLYVSFTINRISKLLLF